MLDDLLGRTELRERIEELEEEKRHLERQLEAEQERRTEAVSDRQDAQERVNRLEDRIADLEGQLEQQRDGYAELDYRHTAEIRGDRLDEMLARVESVETEPEGALTAMVDDDGNVPAAVRDLLGTHARLVTRAAPCLVCADDDGLVAVALDPPVAPDPFVEWADGFRVEREWFRPTGRFALAVVRADLFALGVYQGRERIDFRGFESDVKGAHSKGGFSQGRFERRRDEQVDEHLDRCRETVEDVDADRLYVVGDRQAVEEVPGADATAAVDATGEPREALDDAFRAFWTTRLYGI